MIGNGRDLVSRRTPRCAIGHAGRRDIERLRDHPLDAGCQGQLFLRQSNWPEDWYLLCSRTKWARVNIKSAVRIERGFMFWSNQNLHPSGIQPTIGLEFDNRTKIDPMNYTFDTLMF